MKNAGSVGPALVDGGAPFTGTAASVVDNGSSASASDFTGYTIVEAADLGAAKTLANGHPFLTEGKGRFSLEI